MPRQPTSTRATILATAMRKFIDQGYDKTSLREIAEEIGVTKAALYYHFRTKDDIVDAAFAEYRSQISEVVDWVAQQQPDEARNIGFVDRLLDLLSGDGGLALRFGQANPTVMSREGHAQPDFADDLKRLLTALAGSRPSAEAALRPTLAFGALVIGSLGESPVPLSGSPKARRAAGRTLALELLAPLARKS